MPSAGADPAIVLRPLTAADLDRVYRWCQDERLFLDLVGPFVARTRQEAIAWMTQHWLDPAAADVRLAIWRAEDDVHIGNLYLTPIDRGLGTAEFHIFIGDVAQRGRGYGTAATRAAIRNAARLGLRRLTLEVLSRNLRARHIYEKCGFVVEALRRGAVLKPDGWQDVCVMARALDDSDIAAEDTPALECPGR